ncbi:alpha-1,6-mannosyltransferase subunit [Flammula alnicola]|nr:alpha-1,6-mannosyltransferase subunit [Flammula alnicola]
MSVALDALIFATAWTHVILAPYSKVEESFNLHATHDVLMYGVGIDNLYNYDHFTFPGAVPRTFIGSVLLAWLTTPIIHLAAWLRLISTKFDIQILARLVLASLNAWTLCLIRRGIMRRFGRATGLFFSLLTCSQFHLPFWMGRTIPNMFAMIPVNLSTYCLVDRAPNSTHPSHRSSLWAITLLTFTAIVFRAEVALLLGPLSLQLLFTRRITVFALIKIGLISGLISLGLTITVDSYFWNKYPLWPEFSGIYFNVVEGKSADWGTSPPLAYITSYLPKLLLGSLPLSFIGLISDQRIRSLLLPSLVFIGLISNLGHKEWRFIIYVVPLFNIAAARGSRWMVSRRKNTFLGRLFFLITIGLVAGNLAITILLTKASMANYPGGQALSTFHRLYPFNTAYPLPNVHISNLAAQTGASLFLQLNSPPHYFVPPTHQSPWSYNKTENLSLASLSSTSSPFTHLISEISPSDDSHLRTHWRKVCAIKSFDRWAIDWDLFKGRNKGEILRHLKDVLRFEESDKLWILERR